MRDRPKVPDERIAAGLDYAYGISARALDFLPIGNDAAASTFRVRGERRAFFLKLRVGAPNRASLTVPHHLRLNGIDSVVAPLATISGGLFAELDQYSLILYPWIEGESKLGKTLSPRQWRAWGAIMRAIHRTCPGEELKAQLPQEEYGKRWLGRFARIERALARIRQPHAFANEFAALWRQKAARIEEARARYLSLASRLKARDHEHVICHADIHPANIMVDAAGAIHIVDWDEVILAPKERDLMFFITDGHPNDAVSAFLDGYGDCQADKIGLAYYRYDWVLQEFCDYGERLLLSNELSERELQFSIDEFKRLFAPGDVIELAQQACAAIRS
ncbi:MAG: aminoglycoside phosphotransferase family protein [Chloroflexota bacterium]|nr:aminoglycoside phosphotransferase family protein [Chloroflexota bacterium]